MADGVDVDRVLTVDQDLVDDPYPTWRELRATCPVFREPRFNVVVVTRYDDIVDVARRPQDFSSILAAYGPKGTDRGSVPAALCDIARRTGTPDAERPGRVLELLEAYVPDLQDQLQHVDPPLHTRHRSIVSRWFTPNAVERRADAIRSIACSLIDRFADGGRVEILDALAGPLPATVVADIIGIPEDRRDVFLDWKEEVIGNPEVEFTRASVGRYQQIRQLFLTFIATRRAQPGDDMISTLVTARTATATCSTTRPCSVSSCCSWAGARKRPAKRSPAGCGYWPHVPSCKAICGTAWRRSRLHRGAACASSRRSRASFASRPVRPRLAE